MKNQYFADINDYRKFGLLRTLSGLGEIRTAVCWMLTGSDTRSDGRFTRYLGQPERWRDCDPPLFDSLAACLSGPGTRSVAWAVDHQLLPAACYFADLLEDGLTARRQYFDRFEALSAGSELVFFDPDNGLEVKSVRAGGKNFSKFLAWDELERTYQSGKSVLFYQHFPRIRRDVFTERLASQLLSRLALPGLFSFTSSNVLFMLLPQPRRLDYFSGRCSQLEVAWASQFRLAQILPDAGTPRQA
jgi:hypothetical protein